MTAATAMRSLERALDLLEMLEHADGPRRLSDIAVGCGLPVSTTQRLLNTLIARGYVDRRDNLYEIGLAVMPLAHAYLVHNPLSRAAQPALEELSRTTEMAASLYVRSGDARVVLARVLGPSSPRYLFPIGQRVPLVLGAGRVLLAWDDDDEVRRVFDAASPVIDAQGRQLDPEHLGDALAGIRRDGYYVARSERVFGVASVAAPVLDEHGYPRALVLTSGVDAKLTEDRLGTVRRLTVLAAGAVQQQLHRGGNRLGSLAR